MARATPDLMATRKYKFKKYLLDIGGFEHELLFLLFWRTCAYFGAPNVLVLAHLKYFS